MNEFDTNLDGELLVKKEELKIIYEGPSFDGQMEINNLTSQLSSTEKIIKEILAQLKKDKKISLDLEEVKIFQN